MVTLAVLGVIISVPISAQLDDFALVSETDFLRLYINEDTSEIAIEDLINNQFWFSNPQDRQNERVTAFERASSQFTITHDPGDTVKNSYKYSVAYDEFELVPLSDGIRVNYRVVEEWKQDHYIPHMISKTRMDELILANITEDAEAEVLDLYDLIMLAPLGDDERIPLTGLDQTKVFGDYQVVILNPDFCEKENQLVELTEQLRALADHSSADIEQEKQALEREINSLTATINSEKEKIVWRLLDKVVENRLDLERVNELTHADVSQLVDTPTYLIKDIPVFLAKNAQQGIIDSGYTPFECNEDHLMNNLHPKLDNLATFVVPIEYVLQGRNLVVRVPASELEYPIDVLDPIGDKHTFPLTNLSLLEYFGAANKDQEGYIFVPDGSGALIYLNNGYLFSNAYNAPVYGRDNALSILPEVQTYSQPVRLPVFGLKRDNAAFIGIIEEGAALAKIKADISGRGDSYNRVYAEFSPLPKGKISLELEDTNEMPIYQQEMYQGDFVVRFAFLGSEEANYVGMASYYRQYLIEHYQLQRVESSENIPFYIELVGAINKREPILGIARDVVYPLTTFTQARTVLQSVADRNIENIQVKYNGWLAGGLNHYYPSSANIERALGTASDLQSLVSYMDERDYKLYPSVGFVNVYKDRMFDGFNPRKDAARLLNRLDARVYQYRLDTFDRERQFSYVLSPRRLDRLVDEFLDSYSKHEIPNISLFDLASEVNSDFVDNASLFVDRVRSVEITVAQLQKFKDQNYGIMVDHGNEYVLPFADCILNLPTSGSKHSIVNEEIPFYQIALHGLVNYAGSPLNLSDNQQADLLKMLESGGYPYFMFSYAESHELKDTHFDNLYSIHYQDWLELAQETYRVANDFLHNVQDQFIVNHQRLEENVYQTIYENGKSVIVNYNKEAVNVDGNVIEGENFLIMEEKNHENAMETQINPQ